MKNSSRFEAHDGGELEALEQRRARVLRFFEHALVEREPRQLAVDEQAGPLAAHACTPIGRMISARPNVSMNMSARAVAASCSIVRSPSPSTSRIQVGSLRSRRAICDLLKVLGVERVGEAQNRRAAC